MVVCYAAAFVLSMVFESPFMGLERVLLKRERKHWKQTARTLICIHVEFGNIQILKWLQFSGCILALCLLIVTIVSYANSFDLNETLGNSASHPDPSCLTLGQHFHKYWATLRHFEYWRGREVQQTIIGPRHEKMCLRDMQKSVDPNQPPRQRRGVWSGSALFETRQR